MTRPPCVRLCPAHPGNPRTRIEGESPRFCKGTYGLRSREAASRRMGHENAVSTRPRSRSAFRPSFTSCFALSKIKGAGKTGWPLHPGPPRKRYLRERDDHRYRRIHSGLPCAVVYGLYVRSSVNQRLPPSPSRSFQLRWGLAPAWARQDHTTSPSASMPHVSSIFASTAFRTTFVTTRTPLVSARSGES
jgi:hypothetical protein